MEYFESRRCCGPSTYRIGIGACELAELIENVGVVRHIGDCQGERPRLAVSFKLIYVVARGYGRSDNKRCVEGP